MSAIIIDNQIAHYEVLGRGKPVVFLHGWVGSWRYWIPTMQSLSVAYRTYALDLWGFGDSAKLPSRYNIEQQLDLLDAFLAEMRIGKVALVGHGLGAVIAALYASRHTFITDRYMAVSLPINSGDLNGRLGTESPQALADWLLSSTPGGDTVRSEAVKTNPRAIHNTFDEIIVLDLLALTRRMQTPALLVHSELDPLVSSPGDMYDTDMIPSNTHHIVLDNAGHFPMLDQPSKFNRLVTDFLELSSGESPRQLQLKEEWRRRIR